MKNVDQVFSSLLVVMPLLFYCFCLSNHFFLLASARQCLHHQKSLLLQFQNNLSFISSQGRLQSWNASDDHDCCNWRGVVCDNEGHVTSLHLYAEPISGGIDDSSALFSLQHLQNLTLSYTGLHGTIPNSLSNLTKLSYLDLSGNYFTGPITSSHFAGLHNLVEVDLSNNSLSGSIPSSLFTLPSLERLWLWLENNQFTQLEEFINVTSSRLESIDISYNNLHGRIPSSLFTLPRLKHLDLGSNQLSQLEEFINVSSSILNDLDLSSNNLSGPLPTFIFQLNALSILKLSSNKFNGSVQLTGFLGNLSTLAYLDISNNQIRGIVPYWIWKTSDYLDISHNLFTEFEGPLQSLTSSLSFLDLHHNKLQGPIPVLPGVEYLDYSSNKFSSFIPDSLCDATGLEVLDLSMNNIYGTIPACLMAMNYLRLLNLKNNNLSGPISDTISISCPLWTLNLHGNLLDGPIPKSLAYCSMLEVLDFGSNQINGGFPCFLQKISTLRVLVLRNNRLHGFLRCSTANKTWEMLQIMDIAFNNFSGKLPGKHFTTWERDLLHNENEAGSKFILGQDGYTVQHQVSVTVVSKGLEMELVKILKIFTSVDFSSNHFEGPIPEDLMDFKTLIVLNLSNNALFGEIPSSIGKLEQLESLDLSQNSLSGEIPVQLASLSFLEYLNLSFNHLVGMIPTGTQIQSFPSSSFTGNDRLYGPPFTKKKNGTEPGLLPQQECERLACTVDWNFISVELGLVFGHGIVFGPLLIWKRWRVWYWKLIHKILCWIFPQLYLEYVTKRGQTYTTLRW